MMKFILMASITIIFIFSSCARPPYKVPPTSQSVATDTHINTPAITIYTQNTETAKPSYHCELWEPFISDDHEWVAVSKTCQNPGLPSIQIIGANGENWFFETKDYGNSAILVPEIWSTNGKYLYFSAQPRNSKSTFYDSALSILRMNLGNGGVEAILEQDYKCQFHLLNSISLSSDETLIAYLSLLPPCNTGLTVYNLNTQEKRQIPLGNYYDGGFFLWSPDSTKLAFIVSELDSTEYYPKNETVMVLDLTTMTLENLVTTEHGYVFLPYEWINGQLVIKDRTNNSLFIFDSITKQLIPYTP